MAYPDDQYSGDGGDYGCNGGCCSDDGGAGDGGEGGGDGSGDDGSSEGTDAGAYSGYAGGDGDSGDQGDGSDWSWGSPDAATDSLASAAGDGFSSLWHTAVDTKNLVGDAGAWGLLHVSEAEAGLLDDQVGVQSVHRGIQAEGDAVGGRWDNLMKDLGVRDGERDPDPERSAGKRHGFGG